MPDRRQRLEWLPERGPTGIQYCRRRARRNTGRQRDPQLAEGDRERQRIAADKSSRLHRPLRHERRGVKLPGCMRPWERPAA
jgi:hypothetical protein